MGNNFPTLKFEHWDVKTAFVNAPLKETVFCHQVAGFEKVGTEGQVLRLRKALYGTKQAAHAWQQFLCKILLDLGAKRHPKDECIYLFREREKEEKIDSFLFLGTHVDDLFPLCNEGGERIKLRILGELKRHMQIDNKGTLSFALDVKIERNLNRGTLKISQTAYIKNLLKEYNMESATGRDTPAPLVDINESDLPTTKEEKTLTENMPVRNLIGRLWWLALMSRPDIYCALHKCATHQNKPSQKLWKHLICILKYLKTTETLGLVFSKVSGMHLSECVLFSSPPHRLFSKSLEFLWGKGFGEHVGR